MPDWETGFGFLQSMKKHNRPLLCLELKQGSFASTLNNAEQVDSLMGDIRLAQIVVWLLAGDGEIGLFILYFCPAQFQLAS